MEVVPELEKSDVLEAGNPSITALENFYSKLTEEVEDEGLQIYYTERVIQTFFYGTFAQYDVENLRSNLYTVNDEADSEEIKSLTLLTIGLWHIESGDYYSAEGVLVDWEHELDENPQFYYLSSRHLIENRDQDSVNSAIEEAFRAERESTSDYFRYNISYILVNACTKGIEYDGDNSKIPSDRSVMLELADDMIESVLSHDIDNPDFYSTKAEISILMKNWNEAEAAINQGFGAIRSIHRDHTQFMLDFHLLRYRMNSELERNKLEENISKLDNETDNISNKTTKLSEKIEEENKNIEKIKKDIDQNRIRLIQFLGFFTGLIAVTVTSAQIVATVDDFALGAKLILSLTGSLLITFGGFTTMFVTTDDDSTFLPPLFMIALGIGAISVSFNL